MIGADIVRTTEESGKNAYIDVKFEDTMSAGKKKFRSKDLGEKYANVGSFFLDYLGRYNIPTGYVKSAPSVIRLESHEPAPFVVKARNYLGKSEARLLGAKPDELLDAPVVEFLYDSEKRKPVPESALTSVGVAEPADLQLATRVACKANAVLKSFLERRGVELLEFTLSFGKRNGKLFVVGDLIPPALNARPIDKNAKAPAFKFDASHEARKYADYFIDIISS